MRYFPKSIRDAMRVSGADATCVPVQIDGQAWECAWFVYVAGPECRQDRRLIKRANSPIPMILRPELIRHANAAVVVCKLEIRTIPDDPLLYEILLTPGKVERHYQSLKLLSAQDRWWVFFGDSDYRILHSQQQTVARERRQQLETLTREAFAHDSILKMARNYNADMAMSDIVSYYQLRQDSGPDTARTEH